ncbi:hypothetical protein [Nevskia ramosa]|uniref:hypothetical protein n=1 Tax=Nevskia ramosa TaxID=64002 RepID=UPI002352FA4E|nr:hypothetical protein [Nevskia ramosa]
MSAGIVVGNVIVPKATSCTQLPGPSRVVGIRGGDVSLIPIFWDEGSTEPPAPFVLPYAEVNVELHEGISTYASPKYRSLQREDPTGKSVLKATAIRAALASMIDDQEKINRCLFEPRYKAECIREAASSAMSVSTVRRYLHRYLIFNFDEKVFNPYARSTGRPDRRQVSGAKRGRAGAGVPLYEVRAILMTGIRRYYIKAKRTAHDSYVETVVEYFPEMVEAIVEPSGKRRFTIRPGFESRLPTIDQFRYSIRLLTETESIIRVRPNAVRLERPRKSKSGSARDYVDLPGALFQADATKLKVRICAQWDRSRILSSVTLYIAIDVATTVIGGWFLSPDAPSTALALRLLKQCGSSKRADLERLGMEYVQAEWVEEIPSGLQADRGEWVSIKAHTITRAGISIKVGEPYKPEYKAGVEQTHNLIMEELAREGIPGLHKRHVERGDDDGMRGACLTVLEVEKRVAQAIRRINLRAPVDEVIPAQMIADGHRDVSRIAVWKYRTENEPGAYRRLTERQLFQELLVPTKASVTDKGLLIDTRTYRSDVLDELGWTTKAAGGRAKKIDVFIEERLPSHAFFVNPLTGEMTHAVCRNPAIDMLKLELWELAEYQNHVRTIKKETNFSAAVNASIDRKEFKTTIANAKEEVREAIKKSGVSNNSRNNGRRAATAIESEIANAQYEGGLIRRGILPAPAAEEASTPGLQAESPKEQAQSAQQTVQIIPPIEDIRVAVKPNSGLSRFKFRRTS